MPVKSHFSSLGATLVELVITIMVVSVALAGVLTVINFNNRTSADPMREHQAIAIAEAYLEEILTKEFSDPDGTGLGETRSSFDNVFDYDGLADNGARDQNGTAISGLETYTVTATVTSVDLVGTAGTISAANVWRVQVTVTPPDRDPLTITGYRTNY